MTIKQQGGIFGRNPNFNEIEASSLDVGSVDASSPITVSSSTPALFLMETDTTDLNTRFRNSGGNLQIHTVTDEKGSLDARFRINHSTGEVTVYDNLVIGTSGNGIDFSATSGTGTSELFDDYEEGNWTPVPSSFINYTPTVQVGRYTKVGNLVTASFNMSWTSTNAGSNQFVVAGLPFTSSSTTSYASAAAIGGSDYLTASVQVFAHVQDNTTSIKFFTMNSGSTKSNLLCSSWNASGSTNNIVGTVSYII